MTTMRKIGVHCAVCGIFSLQTKLTSTSSFGPPDLDLRPREPERSALQFRVQRCGDCGYCAASIGKAPPAARVVVESIVYREVLERSKLPSLARSLFCAALVCEAAGETEHSGWRFLEAAWACDDKDARAQARICRERAAEMFQRALEIGKTTSPAAFVHTLIAELWRRAGRFDDALESCVAAEAELESDQFYDADERSGTAAVAALVRSLAIAGDDESRNCAEAFTGND